MLPRLLLSIKVPVSNRYSPPENGIFLQKSFEVVRIGNMFVMARITKMVKHTDQERVFVLVLLNSPMAISS
jgi:hypothetical protein